MDDIVDYSKKLNEEKRKHKKILIITSILCVIFSFSIGFYLSYIVNDNDVNNNYKNKFDAIYEVMKDEWYYGINDGQIEKTLIDNAIAGMTTTSEDPFTRYLTSLGSLATTYDGLGISISEYKEYFLISEVTSKINIQAGLKKGDILISIDGNDLANKDSDYLKTLIENKETVSVVVERNGVRQLPITCYVTTYSPITVFKDFSLSEEYAYIQITEFAKDTADYFEDYLKEAKQNNYNKLILDLRDNPGGYITSVQDCADLLMEKGKIVLTTKDKKGNSYSYKTMSNDKYDFEKIIVLINNNSASGAEALSAALNENMNDKVELVGVTTYGKGSAQKMLYFTDGTYFNYTYALWYTPNGNSIHHTGVEAETIYTGEGIHLLSFTKTTLEKNDYGDDVKNLQIIMQKLGYYTGEINSFYSEELANAVKEFQIANGFEESNQTGNLDSLTIRYILAKYQDDKTISYNKEVSDILMGTYRG